MRDYLEIMPSGIRYTNWLEELFSIQMQCRVFDSQYGYFAKYAMSAHDLTCQ